MLNYQKNAMGVLWRRQNDETQGQKTRVRAGRRETPGNIEPGADELMSFIDYFSAADAHSLELPLVNS